MAHWCDSLWSSGYNIVVRPESDVVNVLSDGKGAVAITAQNNMGYPLKDFVLGATAGSYTVAVSPGTFRKPGFFLPGERVSYQLTISGDSAGAVKVEDLQFFVKFGEELWGSQQSHSYGTWSSSQYAEPISPVVTKKADGSLDTAALTLDSRFLESSGRWTDGWQGQEARHMRYAALADYGDTLDGLDRLLAYYCVGRLSWSEYRVADSNCSGLATICMSGRAPADDGDKWAYQHLWSAIELGARKSGLDASRLATLRKRLMCGAQDDNLGFAGVAMIVLGHLGPDEAARSYLLGLVGPSDLGTIAKASLLLMGAGNDSSTYRAAVTAGLASSNLYVAASCAAALGIADNNDPAVKDVLIPNVDWVEPDYCPLGTDCPKPFFVAHMLDLVTWARRGWKARADDSRNFVSYYADVSEVPATPIWAHLTLAAMLAGLGILWVMSRHWGTRGD
jgi:hypothetical protein